MEEETFTLVDNPRPPRMEGRVDVTFLSTDSQTFISRRRPLGGTTATSLWQVLPPDHSEPGTLSNSFTKELLIHTSLRYQILGTCYFCIFLPTIRDLAWNRSLI